MIKLEELLKNGFEARGEGAFSKKYSRYNKFCYEIYIAGDYINLFIWTEEPVSISRSVKGKTVKQVELWCKKVYNELRKM